MEERRRVLLDSLGYREGAMLLEAEVVEETGIRLRVRPDVPDLPVNLVNEWTDTFIDLSQGLSADELGRINESMQEQFDTAHVRLTEAEDELATLGSVQALDTLEWMEFASTVG